MCLLLTLMIKQISLLILCNHLYDYTLISITFVNPLSPKIQIQILQTDLHTFLLWIVERIWVKIKVFSLW